MDTWIFRYGRKVGRKVGREVHRWMDGWMDMRTDSQRKGHGAPNHGLQSQDDPILDHFGGTSILENSVCVCNTYLY